ASLAEVGVVRALADRLAPDPAAGALPAPGPADQDGQTRNAGLAENDTVRPGDEAGGQRFVDDLELRDDEQLLQGRFAASSQEPRGIRLHAGVRVESQRGVEAGADELGGAGLLQSPGHLAAEPEELVPVLLEALVEPRRLLRKVGQVDARRLVGR